MSDEAIRALLRRWAEAIASGNFGEIGELAAPDYLAYQAGFPGPVTRDQHLQFAEGFFAAFPDAQLTVDDILVEGDRGMMRWTFHGTHQGELMGIPATGRQVTMTGIEVNRVRDGKIVEHWVEMDQLGLMQQLGVIPAPGQAA